MKNRSDVVHGISRQKVKAEFRKLKAAGFPKQALDRAEMVTGEFLTQNPRRRAPGERARKLPKHLRSAYRHGDSHRDSTVRKSARKLVKAAKHAASFEELEGRARTFAGLLKTTGRNREEKARAQGAEWRQAGASGRLEQVVSIGQLQSVGKQLELCVAGTKWARRYLDRVADGETELWVYYRGDARYALIELDTDDRRIAECQTHGGKTPKFSAREARKLLAALHSSGDDQNAFMSVGAYSAFQGKAPPVTPVHDLGDNRRLRVWRYPDEIIAAVGTGKKRAAWTRFRKQDGCWEETDLLSSLLFEDESIAGLQLGELFELACTRPDIRKCLGFDG